MKKALRLKCAGLVVAFFLALFLPALAFAQVPDVPPAAYWGTVTIGGQPAPKGTEVVAKIDGVERGRITVDEAGKYGSPGPLGKKLAVPGTAADEGKTVVFEVGGVLANETVVFYLGDVREVNLTVSGTPQPPQDTTPPAVVSTDPANDATNVPVNKTLTVTFSEDVQEGPAYGSISVKDASGNAVAVTKSIAGKVLTIRPNADLAYSTKYTVTIPAGAVKDVAGNELAKAYVFSFTTAVQQGAKVEVTVPENGVQDNFTVPPGASSVILNQGGAQLEIPQGAFSGAARITFKPVDKTGLPGASVIGQVFEIKIDNVTLDKPVTLRLPAAAGERVRVFKLVGDRWVNLGGTASDGYVEVSLRSFSLFTAASAPAPPTASPAPGTYTGSVQVTLSAESGATILYGLNAAPQTTYTAPITLTASTTIRAVAVKDALTSDEVSFAYTVTASTGGGGGSGGGGGGGGIVRPYVSTTDPADKATGVPVDKEIKVLFNEIVTEGSDFAKITLKDASGNAVEVTARIDGSSLYIKPKAALAYGASYTVVIPANAVKDSDGYSLSSDYTFTFTTAAEQPKPPIAKFKDMAGHWAEGTVAKLAGMGVISGYEDGSFRPDNEISRAEVTAILVRALKLPAGSEQDLLKFKDRASIPDWARGVVAAAAKEGLVRGYPQPDGTVTFEPDRPVSRAEMAALVVRILEKKVGSVAPAELKFVDAGSIPQWARSSVGAAVAKGIVVGYPDNTFRPQKRVTRAEAAAMILRMLEAIGSK